MVDDAKPGLGDSPYMGLGSFTEADRELFHGRELESLELFQLVQRETLTVVFGMSGLGKSSLLRAGLFPSLREHGMLPIVIRLTYQATDLTDQIRNTIAKEIIDREIDAPPPAAGQTLWDYFHRTPLWDTRNRPLVAVLVFDQFEEIFTLGAHDASRDRLLTELGDLIENRIPHAARSADDPEVLPPSFERTKTKVILSLREDYLARLEDLRPTIPSVSGGRFRLRVMDREQAVRAIRHPRTESLIDPAVAEHVARFVAGTNDTANLAEITVEPALLSLVCRELDELRARRGEATISRDLLFGESGRILENFYERSIAGLNTRIGSYLEEHLLTPDGHRTTVAVSTIDRIPAVRSAIDALVDRRILRIEDRLGHPHVEIIHDVLAPVMTRRREQRRSQTARRRRNMRLAALAVGVSLALVATVGGLVYAGTQRRVRTETARLARQNAVASSATLVDEAISLQSHGEIWGAARLLRVAYSIAYSIAGGERSPELDRLVHRFTSLGSTLLATSQPLPAAGLVVLTFSGDGSRLFAALDDGSIIVWDTATWTPSPLKPPRSEIHEGHLARTPGNGSATGSAEAIPMPGMKIVAFAVTNDGTRAVAATRDRVTLWDVSAGRAIASATVESGDVDAVWIGNDGVSVAVAGPEKAKVWQYTQSQLVPWTAWEPSSEICTVSPSNAEHRARNERATRLALEYAVGRHDAPQIGLRRTTFAFSGDGQRIAVSGSGQTAVWQLHSGRPTRVAVACEEDTKLALDFSGSWIAKAVNPLAACVAAKEAFEAWQCAREAVTSRGSSMRLHRIDSGRIVPAEPSEEVLAFDAGSPGVAVVAASPGRLARVDMASGLRTVFDDTCNPTRIAGVSTGRVAVLGTCGSFVRVDGSGRAVSGELPLAIEGRIALTVPANLLAEVTDDRVLRVWKLGRPVDTLVSNPRQAPAPLAETRLAVGGTRWELAAITRGGDKMIAASSDQPKDDDDTDLGGNDSKSEVILGIYDITGNQIKAAGPPLLARARTEGKHGMWSVELDRSESMILAVGRDGHVRVWQVADGRLVFDRGDAKTQHMMTAHFTPDGTRVATADEGGELCAWRRDGQRLGCIATGGRVEQSAISARGVLATGDAMGVVRLWDLSAKPPVVLARHDRGITNLDFDPTGRWLATSSTDGSARVWDLDACAAQCSDIAHIEDTVGIYHVRFATDGKHRWMVAAAQAPRLHVLDLDHPTAHAVLPLRDWANSLDVDAAGRALVCEFGTGVEEWDLVTRRATGRIIPDHPAGWCAARYLGHDRLLTQYTNGTLAIWERTALGDGRVANASVGQIRPRGAHGAVWFGDGDVHLRRDGDPTAPVVRSATVPVVTGDGAVAFTSPTGAVTVIDPHDTVTAGPPHVQGAPQLTIAEGDEIVAIDQDLRYRITSAGAPQRASEHVISSELLHGDAVDAEFSRAGDWLATIAADATLTRYDARGTPVVHRRIEGATHLVQASDGDGVLAFGGAEVGWASDAGTIETRHLNSARACYSALWEPRDGRLAVATEDDRLEQHDLEAGRVTTTTQLEGAGWLYTFLRPGSPAGMPSLFLVASGNTMSLVSRKDGALLAKFPDRLSDKHDLVAAWFVPDNGIVTRDKGGKLSIWDIQMKTRTASWENVTGIDRGPNDRFVVTSSTEIAIKSYRAGKFEVTQSLACPQHSSFSGAVWSRDGRRIAAVAVRRDLHRKTAENDICLWNADGTLVHSWSSDLREISRLSFRADGEALLAVGPEPRLWEVPSGQLIKAFVREDLLTAMYVHGVPYIITSDTAGMIHIYDAHAEKRVGGCQVLADVADNHIEKFAIDPVRSRLVTVDHHGALAVIQIPTGERIREMVPSMGSPNALAVSAAGPWIALAFDDHVSLWDGIDSPKLLDAPSLAALEFSSDGQWLAAVGGASSSTNDDDARTSSGVVKIWQVGHPKPAFELKTPVGLTAVAWTADSRRVIIGGRRGYLKSIDLEPEFGSPEDVCKILDRLAPSTGDRLRAVWSAGSPLASRSSTAR